MSDARFEDGQVEKPLRLTAEAKEDLGVLSMLVQDAVAQTSDMAWLRRKHRFTLLLSRFRWEYADMAERLKRPYERVQTLLSIETVLATRAQGLDPADKDTVVDLLGISFEPAEDGAGTVFLTFAGDGAIALDVECLDVRLQDVSRPYVARSQTRPRHPEDI